MKIIADENIPYATEAFGRLGEVATWPGREITPDVLRDAELLFVRSITKINRELLEGSKVTFVATATIGTDHVDLAYLKERGIRFAYAPGSNATSVSEYVTAALLILSERLGFRLADKTIGLVGVGNVGRRVLKKCQALGMNVICNDPPLQRETGKSLYQPIEEILENADIVSLHVPLTREGPDATFRMADERFLSRLKPGAIFINTARGKAAVDEALKAALDVEQLSAAVLDVWETEPSIDLELMKMAQIASPHVAGYSLDGKLKGTQMIYEAACEYLGVAADWDPAEVLPEPEFKSLEIDCAGKSDEQALSEAALKVCDILGDDRRMREAHDCPPSERAANFDRLRKTYPVRREFHNTTLVLHNPTDVLAGKFSGLGFKLSK